MNTEIDLHKWGEIALKLRQVYPQLTTADLAWRHGTKIEFYRMIAGELGMSRREFETMIDQL